jgi:hypothetical protein
MMLGLESAFDAGLSRFLRENRGAGAFVGRDPRDVGGFIGAAQSTNAGNIESAVDSLVVPPPPNVNRVQPDPAINRPGPYRPRLSLGFAPTAPQASTEVAERLRLQLGRTLNDRLGPSIRVAVEGRRAILSGEVASAHDRILAEELVRLEPGISEVVNRLEARPSDRLVEPAP